MKINNIVSVLLPVVVVAGAVYFFMYNTNTNNPPEEGATAKSATVVVMETAKGTIKAELRTNDAPKTTQNFIDLVGKKFYDGLVFHRVEPNFVIQGGDPEGNGTGGSGMNIPLEIKCQDGTMTEGRTVDVQQCPVALPHTDGALAMARAMDPNSASSQFYITIGDQSFLDGNYAVFGYVTEGKDIVRMIEKGDVITRIYLEK